jgi:hypothetical protein
LSLPLGSVGETSRDVGELLGSSLGILSKFPLVPIIVPLDAAAFDLTFAEQQGTQGYAASPAKHYGHTAEAVNALPFFEE